MPYVAEFDMALPIGNKISVLEKVTIAFKTSEPRPESGNSQTGDIGRWVVNADRPIYPGHLGAKKNVDISKKKVFILFTQKCQNITTKNDVLTDFVC